MTAAHLRSTLAICLCLMLIACSGTPSTQAPTSTGSTGPSVQPSAATGPVESFEGLETPEPIDTGPLPEPSLSTADEIAAALLDPDQAPQAVVSMLQLLGLGLYQPDGTQIRAGSATKDTDFYAFEPEARGLVAMLRGRNDPHEQLSFRDFHAALATLGFTGSAEQLATAYQDAYATDPTALVSELVAALGSVDVDGSLSSFEEWLLLVDGFVPPNEAATAMANAGSWPGPVAFGGGSWGVARQNIQPYVSPAMTAEQIEFGVRLLAIAQAADLVVTTTAMSIHEGHGGPGSAMQASAQVVVGAQQLVGPISGTVILSGNPNATDLRIGWGGDSNANKHGTLSAATSTTDASGEAYVIYVPQAEAANGVGIEMEEPAKIHAFFFLSDLIVELYGPTSALYLPMIRGERERYAAFHAGWHEKVEAAVKILWTDTYNGIDDTITFLGTLDHVDPGPNGAPNYWGIGTATGSRSGWKACNPGIDITPSGTSAAIFNGYTTDSGTLIISAYADVGTPLAGVSTGPMEVPVTGGDGYFSTSFNGTECDYYSHGHIWVTGLILPTP